MDSVTDAPHRLLEAAAEAFADRGFHATTTRDIASRAGLSPAGVYVHFASKEELLYQLSREGHEVARDMLLAAADGADSPTEALRAIMGRFATLARRALPGGPHRAVRVRATSPPSTATPSSRCASRSTRSCATS